MERATSVELAYPDWQSSALPLCYARDPGAGFEPAQELSFSLIQSQGTCQLVDPGIKLSKNFGEPSWICATIAWFRARCPC